MQKNNMLGISHTEKRGLKRHEFTIKQIKSVLSLIVKLIENRILNGMRSIHEMLHVVSVRCVKRKRSNKTISAHVESRLEMNVHLIMIIHAAIRV